MYLHSCLNKPLDVIQSRPLCRHISLNTSPYQLHWNDWKMGIKITCMQGDVVCWLFVHIVHCRFLMMHVFHCAAAAGDHSPDGHSSGMYLHVFRYPPPAVCADSFTTSQSRHKVVIPQFADWEMLQSPSIQSLMHIIFPPPPPPPHTHTHTHALVVQSSRPPPLLPSRPAATRKSTRRSFHLQETFFFNFNTLLPRKRVAMVRVNCSDMVQFY